MPGMRQLEQFYGRNPRRRPGTGGEEVKAGPRQRRGGDAGGRYSRRGHGPAHHRHRRTGSGAGGRRGGRLHGVGGRRPGHRQVHAADPDVRQYRQRRPHGFVCFRRRIRPADQAAGQSPGRFRIGVLRAFRKRHDHRGKAHGAAEAPCDGGGFHPDHVPAGTGPAAFLRCGNPPPSSCAWPRRRASACFWWAM